MFMEEKERTFLQDFFLLILIILRQSAVQIIDLNRIEK